MNKAMRALATAALIVGLAIPAAASAQEIPVESAQQLAAINFGTPLNSSDTTAAASTTNDTPARYTWIAGP